MFREILADSRNRDHARHRQGLAICEGFDRVDDHSADDRVRESAIIFARERV